MIISLKKPGFTLVELMVATTIGTFLALVAVGTMRAISTSAEMVNNSIDSAAEVRYASNLIASDLVNLYRDPNFANMKFVGAVDESGQSIASDLIFYTVGRVKARQDQPEGDVYEVEYSLVQNEEKSVLCRRLWPNPDPNELVVPGGVVTAIAEGIEAFQVRFFDGEQWSDEWPADMETIPKLVEVNILASPLRRGNPGMKSFMVNLVRYEEPTAETTQSTGQTAGTQQQTGTGQTDSTGQTSGTGQNTPSGNTGTRG